jgi:hypothetical protein
LQRSRSRRCQWNRRPNLRNSFHTRRRVNTNTHPHRKLPHLNRRTKLLPNLRSRVLTRFKLTKLTTLSLLRLVH